MNSDCATTTAEVFQSQAPTSERHDSMPDYPAGVVMHHGEEWTVEAIVEDGAIETTVFKHHAQRERAIAYAEARYANVSIQDPTTA